MKELFENIILLELTEDQRQATPNVEVASYEVIRRGRVRLDCLSMAVTRALFRREPDSTTFYSACCCTPPL